MNEFFFSRGSHRRRYNAMAISESIYTQADNLEQLRLNIQEAVQCHFENGDSPKMIHLHLIREEIINV